MASVRIGLVGIGKIARDQHIPVITASPDFRLVSGVNRGDPVDGIENFTSLEEMLAHGPEIDAVVIATPTVDHFQLSRRALTAGKHVLVEKPPCATLTELDQLSYLARTLNRSFFPSWHLRYAPRVGEAKAWLKDRLVQSGRIVWKEDVAESHPGQSWVWQKGGYGVFDPGINALSVLTDIIPEPIYAEEANLYFRVGQQCPCAAEIQLRTESGAVITASLDFHYRGPPSWDMDFATDRGALQLTAAATRLAIDGAAPDSDAEPCGMYAEYAALYRRFAKLIAAGASEVDATPLRLVADIFLVARHHVID
ncbi:MAG: Gfo/Idh/MocA family oxidoreductase [Rhizomicrobium sp.]